MEKLTTWPERLSFLLYALAFFLLSFSLMAHADANPDQFPRQLRVGYQKSGTLIFLKSRGDLEKRLEPLGVKVQWAEFPFGPPMLEALNAGSLDFATTGETPPVFAQAAKGSQLVYVGQEPPSPESEAIVVPADSKIATLAELKGRKVAVAKGSNAHFLLIAALAKAGLSLKDIQPVYLPPAEARAAFERGAVEAWAIWDFYRAAAQVKLKARLLTDGQGLVSNFENYSSRRPFAERYPQLLTIVLEEIAKVDAWAGTHPETAAAILSKQIGLETEILLPAIQRRRYGASPITPQFLASQQKIADTLHSIGLIPQAVKVEQALLKTQ
ncbi:MAG: sulfonate ABC transporter substrate-binding protein [Methylococcaceae bacterium]|nr:sulfonate ABC transporter substrate-binding protein [Methylococcaceae bacterium]